MWFVGQTVEIKPAYDSETGRRTREDEIAYAEAQILDLLADDTADVYVKAIGEVNVSVRRLKAVRS